jgi:hypothetical protein
VIVRVDRKRVHDVGAVGGGGRRGHCRLISGEDHGSLLLREAARARAAARPPLRFQCLVEVLVVWVQPV